VAEFYGATEGNSNLINLENRVGAVGFLAILLPAWLRELLLPVKVVRVDKETGELLKDEHGYAMEIGPGEN
jgi:solute carrier family 27 fatty acid transporter 1/4